MFSKPPSKARRHGFTLLEILMTTALVAVIIGLVCGAFLSGVRFNRTVRHRAQVELELARLSEQIRSQLECMNTSLVRRLAVEGTSQGTRRDAITFITSSLVRHGGMADVSYCIQDDEHGRPYLAYREHAFVYPDNSLANPGPFTPLSHEVSGMDVEYQAQAASNAPGAITSGWIRTWQQQTPPARIRVTLYLGTQGADMPYAMEVEPAIMSLTPAGVSPGMLPPTASPSGSPSASMSPSAAPSMNPMVPMP